MNEAKKTALNSIHQYLESLSAADAAEFFLSPHVSPNLLIEATEESGPSMWIINRSDVYNETLQAMSRHSIPGMADRAAQKIKLRQSTITPLSPPEISKPLKELDKYEAEDFLGHPLCPFEVMLYFCLSPDEDIRGSSALSLTRRILEFPPDWSINPQAKEDIRENYLELLKSDISPFVRSYCARIPLFSELEIHLAIEKENNEHVLAKLMQNPSCSSNALMEAAERNPESEKIQGIFALDARVPSELRMKHKSKSPTFAENIHNWYLN